MDGVIVTGPEVEAQMYVIGDSSVTVPALMEIQISASTETETLATTETARETGGRTIVIAQIEEKDRERGGDHEIEML